MSSKTYPTLLTETRLFERGYRYIIGVDEVGRGAVAGPVAVGVTLLDCNNKDLSSWPDKLQDSKLMSEKSRSEIFPKLESWLTGFAVDFGSSDEVDNQGITESMRRAFSKAFSTLTKGADLRKSLASEGAVILLDGSSNWIADRSSGLEVVMQTKADRDCVSVAAAAVVAKVTRDQLMSSLHENYPEYGFESNKGYASAGHISALRTLGPSPIHRLTWLGKILA